MFSRLISIVASVFAVSGLFATAHAQGTATTAEITAPQASSLAATPTTPQNGEKTLTGEEIQILFSKSPVVKFKQKMIANTGDEQLVLVNTFPDGKHMIFFRRGSRQSKWWIEGNNFCSQPTHPYSSKSR